jgi:hypothetical protein
MDEMIWILYGPPGIGKSSFVAQCEGVLFLSTDPGLRFIKTMKQVVNDWLHFKRIVSYLEVNKPSRYKALAIDTIDPLFVMCSKYMLRKRGIEHPSDEPYGKGYELIRGEFEETILRIRPEKLGYGLFFLDHAREEEGRGRAVRTSKVKPAMHGQALKVLAPMADIIAYYGFGEEAADTGDLERKMFFQPSETMEAKDRTKGGLPESLVIPEEGGFQLVERFLLGDASLKPKSKKKLILKKR